MAIFSALFNKNIILVREQCWKVAMWVGVGCDGDGVTGTGTKEGHRTNYGSLISYLIVLFL